MTDAFYVAALIAVASTFLVITRVNVVHALLYLVVSFLSVSLVFFTLGAPFIAALEVMVYAGAIVVLFIFVVMMLNLGPTTVQQERQWLNPGIWIGPALMSLCLLMELGFLLLGDAGHFPSTSLLHPGAALMIEPKEVGVALFGPYLLGVELAGMLLLAGMVGANHLGRRGELGAPREEKKG